MHVIREKETKKVLYMDYAPSSSLRRGEEIYGDFDAKTMEVGWTGETYVPAYFDIDSKGNIQEMPLAEAAKKGLYKLPEEQKIIKGEIVEKSRAELVEEGLLNLDTLKEEALEMFVTISFGMRREIIPDYKLENASLGVYDEERVAAYRSTVNAFRMEYKRIEALIKGAKNVEELDVIKPNFPKELITNK